MALAELLTDASRALDANANPLSGATWTFYAAGTTTLQSVYTNAALTVAHSNPVVADAGGKFAPIYFDAELSYRGVLKDAGGTIIHDIDPINPNALSSFTELFSAPDGSGNVGFVQYGEAVDETVEIALRRRVYVGQYGAVGDYNTTTGTGTNDAAAFAKAIAALGSGGGKVIVDKGFKCLIDSTVTVPDNVVIEGEGNGKRGDYNTAEANMLGWTPALYVNSTATLSINASSGVRNISIFRKGWQANITSAQVASTFLGTAITIANFSCHALLENLTIIGFEYAIRTVSGISRANCVNIRYVNLDCLNGIYLENAADTSHVSYVHGWPFTTVGSPAETNSAQLLRSGTFIHVGGTINDWCNLAHCFSYGYAIGYRATGNVNSVTFTNCGADHVPGLSDGAKGYVIDGSAREIRIISPQIAAKQYGIYINSDYSNLRVVAAIQNPFIWSTTTAAVLVDDGDVTINGGNMRTGAAAIKTTANAGKVTANGVNFRAFATVFDNYSITVATQHRNCTFTSNTTIAVNPYLTTLASAATITLDGENEFFSIIGTTNISTINPVAAYAGRRITLKFAAALSVVNGAGLLLSGGANFSATGNDTLTLVSDGSAWYEVGRSVN